MSPLSLLLIGAHEFYVGLVFQDSSSQLGQEVGIGEGIYRRYSVLNVLDGIQEIEQD